MSGLVQNLEPNLNIKPVQQYSWLQLNCLRAGHIKDDLVYNQEVLEFVILMIDLAAFHPADRRI